MKKFVIANLIFLTPLGFVGQANVSKQKATKLSIGDKRAKKMNQYKDSVLKTMESETHMTVKSLKVTDSETDTLFNSKIVCNNDMNIAGNVSCNEITGFTSIFDNIVANEKINGKMILTTDIKTTNILTNDIYTEKIRTKFIDNDITCVKPQILTIYRSLIIEIEKSIILIHAHGEALINMNNKYNNSLIKFVIVSQQNKNNVITINTGLIKYKLRYISDYIELLYNDGNYVYIGGNISRDMVG